MTPSPTDEELFTRYVTGGDREAFSTLFRRHGPRLRSYFLRSVGEVSAAEDLVQQTFLHVHRARNDYDPARPFRPWMYTIAANVRRELFRRRQRKPETSLEAEGVPEPQTPSEVRTPEQRAVQRALLDLPTGQREVLLLHWYEGWSFREISEMIGVSHSAVKVRAHRAYQLLRQLMGDPS